MPRQSDREYYLDRASVERHLSKTASDPNAALVHKQLADRYEALADQPAGHRSGLTLVRMVQTSTTA
jgi:hypothetical protein